MVLPGLSDSSTSGAASLEPQPARASSTSGRATSGRARSGRFTGRRRLAERLRAPVEPCHVAEDRLAVVVLLDEALVVPRRLGVLVRSPALPGLVHAEVAQRPVDR